MTNKSAFQLIKENWAVVTTIALLIAGYANLHYQVGEHHEKISRLELRDEAKGEDISELKLAIRELQIILQRIDKRTEVLDNVGRLQFN